MENECAHGYPDYHRRHCVNCAYEDEIAELKAEIETIRMDFAIVEANLAEVTERSLKRKEALAEIKGATMSMFADKDAMIRYMKKTAREALD